MPALREFGIHPCNGRSAANMAGSLFPTPSQLTRSEWRRQRPIETMSRWCPSHHHHHHHDHHHHLHHIIIVAIKLVVCGVWVRVCGHLGQKNMPRPFVSKKTRTKHRLLQWFSVYPQNWQHVDVVRKRQRKWQHGAKKTRWSESAYMSISLHFPTKTRQFTLLHSCFESLHFNFLTYIFRGFILAILILENSEYRQWSCQPCRNISQMHVSTILQFWKLRMNKVNTMKHKTIIGKWIDHRFGGK